MVRTRLPPVGRDGREHGIFATSGATYSDDFFTEDAGEVVGVPAGRTGPGADRRRRAGRPARRVLRDHRACRAIDRLRPQSTARSAVTSRNTARSRPDRSASCTSSAPATCDDPAPGEPKSAGRSSGSLHRKAEPPCPSPSSTSPSTARTPRALAASGPASSAEGRCRRQRVLRHREQGRRRHRADVHPGPRGPQRQEPAPPRPRHRRLGRRGRPARRPRGQARSTSTTSTAPTGSPSPTPKATSSTSPRSADELILVRGCRRTSPRPSSANQFVQEGSGLRHRPPEGAAELAGRGLEHGVQVPLGRLPVIAPAADVELLAGQRDQRGRPAGPAPRRRRW